jgi:hypothetical protein
MPAAVVLRFSNTSADDVLVVLEPWATALPRLEPISASETRARPLPDGGGTAVSLEGEPTVADMMAPYAQDAVDHALSSSGVSLDLTDWK